jgi:acetyl-CoA decarbonylase/synthase complex subunit gamma
MALTGIQIYKMLPKTNCKDCGDPTCLAFAMKLAAGKAELSQCPHVSDEAQASLAEASAPPIRVVTLGEGDDAFKTGGETVKYRHEKTFVNATGIMVGLCNDTADAKVDAELKNLADVSFERVGYTLAADGVYALDSKGDKDSFIALVKKVADATQKGIIIDSSDFDTVKAAAAVLSGRKFAAAGCTCDNVDDYIALAKETGCVVVAKGETLEALQAAGDKLVTAGLKEVILDPQAPSFKDAMTANIAIRRSALDKKCRGLGFPVLNCSLALTEDIFQEAVYANALLAKYAGFLVVSTLDPAFMLPLTVNRLNVFTDPQRPMTMDQGIYDINNPGEDCPVIITTNFALTYFVVSAEVESSRVPTKLLIMDTDGMSVLTAWSAGKFVADAMAPFVQKSGITDQINHKKIIIPGYVAQLSGEFQEELGSDWEVIIGPREAADLPKFLKEYGK